MYDIVVYLNNTLHEKFSDVFWRRLYLIVSNDTPNSARSTRSLFESESRIWKSQFCHLSKEMIHTDLNGLSRHRRVLCGGNVEICGVFDLGLLRRH